MSQAANAPARVLLVAAPGPARDADASLLARAGLAVFEAGTLREARLLGAVDPGLYLIDRALPDGDGLALLADVKAEADHFLPALVACGSDAAERVQALAAGADDAISRPFLSDELLARVQALLRLKTTHDRARAVQRDLERLVASDPLTGLHNRRALLDRLKQELERYSRYRMPLALAMLDLDGFKPINDEHGHLFGDHVLRSVADAILRSVRTLDVPARYGGDEFALILPQTDGPGALRVCERVLRNVAALEIVQGQTRAKISMSLGLGIYPGDGVVTVEDLLRSADEALYRAKRAGRNRVCAVSAVRAELPATA